MSVLKPKNQSLELIFLKTVSDTGKQALETRRFKNLKGDAAPDAIMSVAKAIAGISLGSFSQYQVTVSSELAEA
ncbi:DUF1659 domain-containing protein [Proteiniclasticum sp. QWL-01]|uniref:DUF1659 domain-containing protein n=1 Tax=Proteiniclasticum sp. QWL-01 TaxID=3036945 RepID=UPI0021FCD7E3|nr:DUF1659 domain-containing protein [Proteiniclasticum sp. QWL-01]UUM11921.1 DUF1659 domain-containing protein [Clostridiaceae bacterium HFYG-1003]WFF73421.1 DUF1659 domain-containing protein [Proteiniclasticum sp. QWL-01]